MDALLLVFIIIISILLLLVNVYILAVYIHPDDKGFGNSIFPKIIIVLGLSLAWGQMFMVPLDVANSRGDGGGINMDLFWKIILICDAVLLIALIPFSIFKYEGDDEDGFWKRTCSAICYTIGTIAFFGLAIGVSYAFLREASIPIQVYTYSADSLEASTTETSWATLSAASVATDDTLTMNVSIPVYIMGFFSLLGWFFFLLFGGMGLFAIPMDFINDFRYRPKKKSRKELENTKVELTRKNQELLELAKNLKGSTERVGNEGGFFSKRRLESKVNRDKNKFKVSFLAFEKEYEIWVLEKNYKDSNPLIYCMKLVLGVLCFVVSIIWWLQVLLHCVIKVNGYPLTGFLNNMLVYLQEKAGVGFISTGIFCFMSIYLIWAVTKGNVKFGLRIPFLFTLHPMKPNETLMNAFLFNVWLIIVSSIACIEFVTNAFSQYVRLTTVEMLFGVQIKYLKFYNFFYKNDIFEIAFLVWSFLGLIFLFFCGYNQPQELKQIEKLKKEAAKIKK